MRYSAPPATKIAETTVVSKKARTLLRGLRVPAVRLRCCDDAVLPWAEHARQAAGRTGPLRPRQRVLPWRWRPAAARHYRADLAEPSKDGANSVAAPRCQK